MKPQPEARVMGGDDAIMMGWRDPAVAGVKHHTYFQE